MLYSSFSLFLSIPWNHGFLFIPFSQSLQSLFLLMLKPSQIWPVGAPSSWPLVLLLCPCSSLRGYQLEKQNQYLIILLQLYQYLLQSYIVYLLYDYLYIYMLLKYINRFSMLIYNYTLICNYIFVYKLQIYLGITYL